MDPVVKFLGLLLLTRFLECKISFANRFLQPRLIKTNNGRIQCTLGLPM